MPLKNIAAKTEALTSTLFDSVNPKLTNDRVIIWLFLFLFSFSSNAQKVDSLKDVYSQYPSINVAYSLSQYYFSKDVDSSEYFARSSYLLLDESSSDSLRGRITANLGLCFIESSKYDSGEYYLMRALSLQENATQSDLAGLSSTYNSLGNLNFYRKNLLKTAEWYQKSLSIDQQIGDKGRLAKSYGNIGLIYRAMRNDQAVMHSYQQALRLLREVGDQSSELRILVNMTVAYGSRGFKLHSLDSAIYYGREALDLGKALNFPFGIAKAQGALCGVLIRKGDSQSKFLDEGAQMARDAGDFFKKSNFRNGYLDARLNEGFAYEALNQPEKAISIAQEVREAGYATDECDRLASMAHAKLGDYQKALILFQSFQKTVDSIRINGERTRLAEFQIGFEAEKAKSEKAEADLKTKEAKEASSRNRLLFFGALLLALLIGVSSLLFFAKQRQARKTELALLELKTTQKQLALEKQYRDSELKALKAQMNPHFIFNVLNSIQEYIILNDKANASDYLSMFSHLIRSYLDQSGKKSISLQEETETLNRYLQLEALRFGDDFSTRMEVDEKLDQETTEISPMIIQPYVENAIKHGLFNKEGVKTLNIVMQKDENGFLRCVIHDNGIGREEAAKIKASKPTLHESFALGATQSRMELYNQHSASKISVEVNDLYDDENVASGTKVTILIPLKA